MSITAYPDRYIDESGAVHWVTGDEWHGLHKACNEVPLGSTIYVFGSIYGIDWQGAPGKGKSVWRRDGPLNFRIVGPGEHSRQAEIVSMFFDDQNEGIEELVFTDLQINVIGDGSDYPIVAVQNPRPGRLVFRRIQARVASGSIKSFFRLYNHEVVATRVTGQGTREYVFYCTGTKLTMRHLTAKKCGRGAMQQVLRNVEGEFNGIPLTNLDVDHDDVLDIENVVATDCGWDGSSAISIAGAANVRIKDVDIQTAEKTGAIYIRYENKQNEQERDVHWSQGRAIDFGRILGEPSRRAHHEVVLNLEDSVIDMPGADRDLIYVDSTNLLWVSSNEHTRVTSPRSAMHLEMNGTGSVRRPAGFETHGPAGETLAQRDIAEVRMAGRYYNWERTGGWNEHEVFKRNNQVFVPAEYYSARRG